MATATSHKSFGFSRDYRLTKPAEFRRVFAKPRRSSDKFFTVLYRSNDKNGPRLGFAVAKKRIARASGRNRVRRIARESFRLNRHQLGSYDIIILAQSRAGTAANAQLAASLTKHWTALAAS